MPENYPLRRSPRKWWEWDYIADCAEQLGVLAPTTTAVGLGAGDEPLIFYFADKCRRVIASDLYSPNTVWREARFANTSRILDASPIPYPRSRVDATQRRYAADRHPGAIHRFCVVVLEH